MLVLTRKESESLYIDNIMITIVGIENDKVRIGIDAPRSMHIFREELLTETSVENRNAAGSVFISEDSDEKRRLSPIFTALNKSTGKKDV